MIDHNRIEELERALKLSLQLIDTLVDSKFSLRETRMTWMPIETAPKDGTVVLLCTGSGVEVGYWHEGKCLEPRGWNIIPHGGGPVYWRWDTASYWLPIISDLGVMP